PPGLTTQTPYRAVIWRPPEDFSTAWSLAERTAISNYLNSGGALLVASMEVLSRLEEAGATDFIHNVLHIQSYVADPQSSGAPEIMGLPVDPLTGGPALTLVYPSYAILWAAWLGP